MAGFGGVVKGKAEARSAERKPWRGCGEEHGGVNSTLLLADWACGGTSLGLRLSIFYYYFYFIFIA